MKTSITTSLPKWTLLFMLSVSLQFCKSSKSAVVARTAMDNEPTISYVSDIRPIMVASCTPCHFPENGRKEMLDTHEATKEYIDDIIRRVALSADDADYMPYKSKRPALTDEQVEKFRMWAKQGFGQ